MSKLRVGYSQRQGRRKCVLGTDAPEDRRMERLVEKRLVLTQGNREHCSTAADLGKCFLDGQGQDEQRVARECPMKAPTCLL